MHKVLYIIKLVSLMEYMLLVNKHTFEKNLYYKTEEAISITINYPSFESKEFPSFVKYLNEYYFSKLVLHSKYEIYRLYKLAQSEYDYAMANDFPFRRYEYYLDFNITYNKNCNLSLYYDTYIYTGGAHGNTIRRSDTWNLQTGKLMSVTDYLEDKGNYREFLIGEIIRIIEETIGTDRFIYFEDYNQLVRDTFQEDSFYLIEDINESNNNKPDDQKSGYIYNEDDSSDSTSGIIIYFQQYDIGPYVSGITKFFIPFTNKNLRSPLCK